MDSDKKPYIRLFAGYPFTKDLQARFKSDGDFAPFIKVMKEGKAYIGLYHDQKEYSFEDLSHFAKELEKILVDRIQDIHLPKPCFFPQIFIP